ncbi:IS1 family transposase [Leptolyngbya sp. FACHB-261]|nr:IS1 family transposase [Leptolyngbya sp. FACHB-261]
MSCPLCGHAKAHKHGKLPNGHQRYLCPACYQTFSEFFDSLYYRRQISYEQVRQVLQAYSKGSSLRDISRTTRLAYNTVVGIWIWQHSRLKTTAVQRQD